MASLFTQAAVEHFNPTVYDLQKQRTIAGLELLLPKMISIDQSDRCLRRSAIIFS